VIRQNPEDLVKFSKEYFEAKYKENQAKNAAPKK
jgi:hypothetical protein